MGAGSGLLSGAIWGGLVGLIFLNPLAGMALGGAVGAGAGALSGSLADYGIDDKFIVSLGETIPENSSALFVLLRKIQWDRVMVDFPGLQGRVLKTSLSLEQEQRLKEALEGTLPKTS